MERLQKAIWIMIGVTAVALIVAYFMYSQLIPEQPAPSPDLGVIDHPSLEYMATHHGIDVSDHSGTVDWRRVAAEGFAFAFVKATEGDDLLDTMFASHWRELKAAGLMRGAYHFYVTEDDPEEQALFFLSTVTLEPGDLAPVVDVELIGHNTKPGLSGRLQRWLDIVEDHYGVKPIIYTTAKFWNEHLSDGFGEYPLWIAEYEVDAPKIPNGWDTWHLWQWKGDSTVAGVEKGADVTRVNHPNVPLGELVVVE